MYQDPSENARISYNRRRWAVGSSEILQDHYDASNKTRTSFWLNWTGSLTLLKMTAFVVQDCFSNFGFTQFVLHPTRFNYDGSGNILYLIFCNEYIGTTIDKLYKSSIQQVGVVCASPSLLFDYFEDLIESNHRWNILCNFILGIILMIQ